MKRKVSFLGTIIAIVLVLGCLMGFLGAQAEAQYVHVDELDASLFTDSNHPWADYTHMINETTNHTPLKLDQEEIVRGIWMHGNNDNTTPTTLEININGKNFTGFYARIGVHSDMPGSVGFRFYADDELLYESDTYWSSSSSNEISVPLENANVFKIEIDNGGDGYGSDWAVLGNARFSTTEYIQVERPTPTPIPTPVPIIPGHEAYLSDLPRDAFEVLAYPWDGYDIFLDTNGNRAKLSIAGQTYDKGIWMHAHPEYDLSEVEIDISQYDFTSLRVKVGIDDTMGNGGLGTCEFIIYGDGEELAASELMSGGAAAQELVANIGGVKILTLCVTNGGDNHSSDWADWVNPVLGYEFEQPTPTPTPTEKPTIEPTESPNVTNEPTTTPDITATPTVKPTDTGDKSITGDNSTMLIIFIVIAAIVIVGCVVFIVMKKKTSGA